MASKYFDFIAKKNRDFKSCGLTVARDDLNKHLFEYQKDITFRGLNMGRMAVFADTGMGKTLIQLAYGDELVKSGETVFALAPLAVSRQSVEEGAKFGIKVNLCESESDIVRGAINITNYDKLHKFSPEGIGGVILDESSLIKNHKGKFTEQITQFIKNIPYRLPCTATAAPNDFMEFGTHAEILGVMSREEMLATFFKHDGGETSKWRLKGHAEAEFWKWLCSWAVVIRRPSDFGYSDEGFDLPPLEDIHHIVEGQLQPKDGELIASIGNMNDRRAARQASMELRCKKAAELVNSSDEEWLIWCKYNPEGDLLEKLIPDAVQVAGSDKPEKKAERMTAFSHGEVRALISKPEICGFGMNWQHCRNLLFVGIDDSWEKLYQATNRCYRHGQNRTVYRHLIYSDQEQIVWDNLKRKEMQAEQMWREMSKYNGLFLPSKSGRQTADYSPTVDMTLPSWFQEIYDAS